MKVKDSLVYVAAEPYRFSCFILFKELWGVNNFFNKSNKSNIKQGLPVAPSWVLLAQGKAAWHYHRHIAKH